MDEAEQIQARTLIIVDFSIILCFFNLLWVISP